MEESDRVLVMLNTLMDISEAESGAMQLRREPVDLEEVVDRAADLYKEVADAKGMTITLQPERDSEKGPEAARVDALIVEGDRPRLEQVAANLIDNAIKYTATGGRVEVSVSRSGPNALLTVRDNGVGIPENELPLIWNRLFRGDRSRTERGLGLGLSLVRAIVHAHGGTVAVQSEFGRGATFTVSLPLA
jgi:signal transduction histidine kinase